MPPHVDPIPSTAPALARWFSEEVHLHEQDLRAYLRGKFPSLDDVDDLIQETYARILRARREGGVASPRPYLFATARHAALDILRRRTIVPFEPLGHVFKLT